MFDGGMVRQIVEASILRWQIKTARIDSATLMRGHQSHPIIKASSSKPSVPSSVEIHLAAKLSVHEDNVADGQRHPQAPPDQADGERVRAGDGAD